VSVSPAGGPLEEDHVVLRCKADKLIYGNLTWLGVTNVSRSEQIAPVQPCRPWWNVTALGDDLEVLVFYSSCIFIFT